MQSLCVKVFLLLCFLGIIGAADSQESTSETKEFRTQKVGIRFERGWNCRNKREDSEYCQTWASGHTSVDSNGLTATYAFNTTENINSPPLLVEGSLQYISQLIPAGVLTALFMETITDTKCSVSGMLQAMNPTWVVEPFEGKSDRPIRLYQRRDKQGNTLYYEWLEITLSGAYDPEWQDSRELRKKYENTKKAKQNDKEEL